MLGAITSGGNTSAASAVALNLSSLAVGGSLSAGSIGNLTVVGTVGQDATLSSFAGILGMLAVGDDIVRIEALGSIAGSFHAGDNIGEVVTLGDLAAVLTAGGACATGDPDADADGCGNIGHVRAWNHITGALTAENSIGVAGLGSEPPGIYAGGLIAPAGGINAPLIGVLHEGDRSLFIDLPVPPPVPDGELGSLTADAYGRLMRWGEDLQAARIATIAQAGAAAGAAQAALAQAAEKLAEVQMAMLARLDDIAAQAQLALLRAEALAGRALEVARINSEGAQRMAREAGRIAEIQVQDELAALLKEAEFREHANDDAVLFVTENALLAENVHWKDRTAALQQAQGIYDTRTSVFVGLFVSKAVDFMWDVVHDTLAACGIVAEFVPGLGNLIAAACDGTNALLYVARGKWGEALGSAVAIVPYVGTLARQGVRAAKPILKTGGRQILKVVGGEAVEAGAQAGARAGFRNVSRWVSQTPVGQAARQLKCTVGRVTRLWPGCFVGATEVWYLAWGRPVWLVTAAGVFAAGPALVLVLHRRRPEDQTEAIDEVFSADGPGHDGGNDDPLPPIDPQDAEFAELCDQLFHTDADEPFWKEPSVADVSNEDASWSDANSLSPWQTVGVRAPLGAGLSTSLPVRPQVSAALTSGMCPGPSQRQHREPEAVAHPKSQHRRTNKWLWPLTGFCTVLLAVCLVMGLTGSHLTTQPIKQFEPGINVPEDRIHGDNDLSLGETVDPATWRRILLRAPKSDGSIAEGDLLRPLTWLTERNARVGGTVYIAVPECGIDGNAQVLSIGPCPPIKNIPGSRIVTGVWKHHSASVIDLWIEGLDSPIGTTSNHPFWSEDREDYVRADKLRPGERLWSIDGRNPRVVRVRTRPDLHSIYNLEVHVDHVYHVAATGVLVHNVDLPWFAYERHVFDVLGLSLNDLHVHIRSEKLGLSRFVDNLAGRHAYEITKINFQSSFDRLDDFQVLQRKIAQLALDGQLLEEGLIRKLTIVTPDDLPTSGRGAEFTRLLQRLQRKFGANVEWRRICP